MSNLCFGVRKGKKGEGEYITNGECRVNEQR